MSSKQGSVSEMLPHNHVLDCARILVQQFAKHGHVTRDSRLYRMFFVDLVSSIVSVRVILQRGSHKKAHSYCGQVTVEYSLHWRVLRKNTG